jgi:hypothetical protein
MEKNSKALFEQAQLPKIHQQMLKHCVRNGKASPI